MAVALPMMIAVATKSTAWYAMYVLAAYYFIQIIDNNYIVPKIVASKVKINALFSIIAVLAGNAVAATDEGRAILAAGLKQLL